MNAIIDKKLEKDAITGDAEAQYKLGDYYRSYSIREGWNRAEIAKALKWYRKAADQGHAKAQYSVGYYYHHDVRHNNFLVQMGFFVERNKIEAVKWLRKAAEQNYAP